MNNRRSPAVGISDLLSTEIAEVLDGMTVMSSQTFALAVRVANGGVNVGSTAIRVANTSTQPVPVIFPATQQIIVGEVEVKNDAGNPVPVSGTIALSTGTLASLETISALQSGAWSITQLNTTMSLSAASLAALETITVANPTTAVLIENPTTAVRVTNTTGIAVPVGEQNQLVPKKYDFIDLGYSTGGDLTSVIYKTGGSGGTTVATLSLAYTGDGDLDTVTRS